MTGREMRAAVRELNRRGPLGPRGGRLESVGVILLVAVFAVVVGLWLYPRPLPEEPSASLTGTMTSSAPSPALQPVPHPVPQPLPADEPAASATIEPAEGSPSGSPAPALTTAVANHPAAPAVADNGAVAVGRQEPRPERIEDLLVQLNGRSSRRAALQKVLNLWQSGAAISASLEELETDDEFFRYAARQLGLEIERLEADAALLVKLDLPAVLMFDLPNRSDSGYLALTRLAAGLVLEGGDAPPMTVAIEDLSPNYTRTAYVVWKNFKALRGTIPLTSDAGTVILLKSLLKEIGIDGLGVDARYDPLTRQVVEQLQARYGIPADGFVGPLTKIVLYNAHAGLAKPRLLIP